MLFSREEGLSGYCKWFQQLASDVHRGSDESAHLVVGEFRETRSLSRSYRTCILWPAPKRAVPTCFSPLNQSNVDPLVTPTHTSLMQGNHGPNIAAPRVAVPVEPRRENRLHIAV